MEVSYETIIILAGAVMVSAALYHQCIFPLKLGHGLSPCGCGIYHIALS